MERLKILFDLVKKNPKIIVVVGLVGIALIFMSGFFKSDNSTQKTTSTQIKSQEYAEQLESQLESQISEVVSGKVNVMVTLETGVEYIYASEAKNNVSEIEDNAAQDKSKSQVDKESENNYILYKDENGNEVPLVVTEIMPTVKGVVVGCENGENEVIANAIKNLVTTALNVSDSKVCVVGLDLG